MLTSIISKNSSYLYSQYFLGRSQPRLALFLAFLCCFRILAHCMSSRMRKTHSKTRQRRQQWENKMKKKNTPRLTRDTETGSVHLRHHVDMKTGMYRGRKVIDVEKRQAKQVAKVAAQKQASEE